MTGKMLTIYDRMVTDCSSWLIHLEIGAMVVHITIPVVSAIPVIISIWDQCWNFSDLTMDLMDNGVPLEALVAVTTLLASWKPTKKKRCWSGVAPCMVELEGGWPDHRCLVDFLNAERRSAQLNGSKIHRPKKNVVRGGTVQLFDVWLASEKKTLGS